MSTCSRVIPIAKAALAVADDPSMAMKAMPSKSGESVADSSFGMPDSVQFDMKN
jgi:hypothetical protein